MADMISAKLDPVARNSIWREHCEKQLRYLSLNTNFSIRDPTKMTVLPEKPNYVLPHNRVTPDDEEDAMNTLKERCSVKDADIVPPEKYECPQTAAQAVGWHAKPLSKANPMFVYRRGSCDITRYADKYFEMSGVTPFTRKGV